MTGRGAATNLRLKTLEKQALNWELRNIYHHHPESKKRKSSEENSGFIHPYGRYGNAVKTRKTVSTIAILWPVKAVFEKRAATVEVDTFVFPAKWTSVSDFWVRPRSGREKVAETRPPSPETNLRLTNLRLGNAWNWAISLE